MSQHTAIDPRERQTVTFDCGLEVSGPDRDGDYEVSIAMAGFLHGCIGSEVERERGRRSAKAEGR